MEETLQELFPSWYEESFEFEIPDYEVEPLPMSLEIEQDGNGMGFVFWSAADYAEEPESD